MAETASTMIPLGTIAPKFILLDVCADKMRSLEEFKSEKATVIMFLCNHCPYVQFILPKLLDIANEYKQKGISFVAISSNDVDAYPEDGPEAMRMEAEKKHYPFPYLYDESQAVAKAYHAVCTPDFFVFDKDLKCVYRGRFDNATPYNNQPVTGVDLINALKALLNNQPISSTQVASLGCNIKWKKNHSSPP